MAETDMPAGAPPSPPGRGEQWEQSNAEFLAASLEWLRIVLRQHAEAGRARTEGGAPTTRPAPLQITPPEEVKRLRWGQRPREGPPPAPAIEAVPSAGPDELTAALARVAEAEAALPPPALVDLTSRLELSRFERDTLLMCLAEELDPGIGALFARAHGSDSMPFPTLGLALAVLPDPAWEAISPRGGLRFWRLVEISHPSGSALVTSPMRADERIVNHVKGLDYLDERIAVLVSRLSPGAEAALPQSQQLAVARCMGAWEHVPAAPVVHMIGGQPGSKHLVAARAAAAFGLTTYRLPATLLPANAADLDQLARLWERETALMPVALFVDADDDTQPESETLPVGQFVTRLNTPVFLSSRDARPGLGRPAVVVDVAPPTTRERAAAWRDALGPGAATVDVDLLASQFALDVPAIAEVARTNEPDAVWDACLARTRPRLNGLAQRLRPVVGWDDIVLPAQAEGLLRQIAGQVRSQETVYDTWGFGERMSRGLGVTALFAGPSGTGKTMAAEVLAHELDLDLYRTDLSAVMSKYIGETEKNLRRLFDAAEAGGALLFMDEADALLGKRSEVRDAHDRYANVQIDYLLQRMESYRGLAVMATNVRSALDPAFVRRLRFVVEFPFPDAAQRREIWQRAFPQDAPGRDGLDYDHLARFDVSGGMTRNIALNAAFLAAAADSQITMPLVLQAAQEEFRKLKQSARQRDFVWSPRVAS